MLGGYSYWSLKTGVYGWEVPTAPALIITFLFLVMLGVLIELVAFRPLRTASPLAKLAASLGVLLVAQAGVALAFGISSKPQPPVLPRDTVRLFGSIVPIDRLILPAIVLAVTLALSLLFRLSRFGLATRAASENEVGAMLLGLSPNQLALANTRARHRRRRRARRPRRLDHPARLDVAAAPGRAGPDRGALRPLHVVLDRGHGRASRSGCSRTSSTTSRRMSWFPTDNGVAMPGIQPLLVFGLMVVAMFVRGTSLPSRGELVEQRLPLAPRAERLWRHGVARRRSAAVVALIVLPVRLPAGADHVAAGDDHVPLARRDHRLRRPDLGRSARARRRLRLHRLPPRDRPRHRLPAGDADRRRGRHRAAGSSIAVSALRVRGVSLAVVTLAAAVAIEQFVFLNTTWGGGSSSSPVPEPRSSASTSGRTASFRGLDGKLPSPVFGFFVVAVTLALGLLVANLRRSSLGQRMLAVRSNERAAAAAGINVRNVKLAAFGDQLVHRRASPARSTATTSARSRSAASLP